MTSIILKYPVITIYGDLLVDSGIEITLDNIDNIISLNPITFPKYKFLSYKDIRQDIIENIHQDPYQTIFRENIGDDLITYMEDIILPLPVIETIYHFKTYDYYTYRHFLMVLILTTLLSKEIIKNKDDLLNNIKAGSSHDIGKLCIPESILKKSTALTRMEKNDLKQHTLTGYFLLQYYFNHQESHIPLAARNHHERRDGSGYPFHIKLNDSISDIIVVSDIFDALISSRPYRPSPYDIRSALDEITTMALDHKISMNVVRALVNFNRGNKNHYSECIVSHDKRGKPPTDNLYDKIIK